MPTKGKQEPLHAGSASVLSAFLAFLNPNTIPGYSNPARQYAETPTTPPIWADQVHRGELVYPPGDPRGKVQEEVKKALAERPKKKPPKKPVRIPAEKWQKDLIASSKKKKPPVSSSRGGSDYGYYKNGRFIVDTSQYQTSMPRRFYKKKSWGKKRYVRKASMPTNSLWSAGRKGTEVKFIDTDAVAQSLTGGTMAFIGPLNGVATGTDFNTRIGRNIKCVKISWRISIEDNTNPSNQFRLIIVQDKQPNGAVFNPGDLFADTTSGDVMMTSLLNLNNKERFTICRDKMLYTQSANQCNTFWKGTCRFSFRTQYMLTTAAIGAISTNSLYAIIVSHYTLTGGSASNNLNYWYRLRFIDE